MIPLIGVKKIVIEHYKAVKANSNYFWTFILFVLVPFVVSIILVAFDKLLTENAATTLITAFAIFVGFLLNVLLLLFAIVDKFEKEEYEVERKKLLRELFVNCVYSLIVATSILVLLIFMILVNSWKNTQFLAIFSFIIYFIFIHFIMTLFMIFRSLFGLLFDEESEVECKP